MKKNRRQSNKNSGGHSFVFLALVFLFFFVVPVLLLGPILRTSFVDDFQPSNSIGDVAIDAPVAIGGRGAFLKVLPSELFAPSLGKYFFVVAWFNIQDLPSSGQRVFLLSRYESSKSTKSGYAIAISRTIDSLRPEVYWRDEAGRGGWYSFSDVKILPGYWFMVGLTYYDDTKLGMYVGSYEGNGRVILQPAGGYSFPEPILPASMYPLKVGSVKTGLFTGNIGPVGIFAKESRDHVEIKSIFKNFLKSPMAVPDTFKKDEILFWTPDAKHDLSIYNHELKFVDPEKDPEEMHDL